MRCNFYFLLYLSVNSLILLVHCKSIPNNNAVPDAYTTVKNKNENYQIYVKQENVNEAQNLSRQLTQFQQNKDQRDIVKLILKDGKKIEMILDSIVEKFYENFQKACCFEISINKGDNQNKHFLINILAQSLFFYNKKINGKKGNVNYQNFLIEVYNFKSNVSFDCPLEENKCMYNNENFNSAKRLLGFVILIRYMILESLNNLNSQQQIANGINLNLIKETVNNVINTLNHVVKEQNWSSTFLNEINKQLRTIIEKESNTKFNDVEKAYQNLITILKKYAETNRLYINITYCPLTSNDYLTMNQSISNLWSNEVFGDLTNYIQKNSNFLSSEYGDRSDLNMGEILTIIENTKKYFQNTLNKYQNSCTKQSTRIANNRRNLAINIHNFFLRCFTITKDIKNFIDDMLELIYYKDFKKLKLNYQIILFNDLLFDMQKILSSNDNYIQKSNKIRKLYNQLKNGNSVNLKKYVSNIFIDYLRHMNDIIVIYNHNCPGSKNPIMTFQRKSISDSIKATYQVQKMLQDNISVMEMKENYQNSAMQSIINSKNYNVDNLIQNCQTPNGTLAKIKEIEYHTQEMYILNEIYFEYRKFFSNLETELNIHPFDDINLNAFLSNYSSTMKSIKTDLQVYSPDNGNSIILNLTQILKDTKNLSKTFFAKESYTRPVLTDNEKKNCTLIDSILKKQLKIATDFFETMYNNYKCNNVNINNNSKIVEVNISKLINFTTESIRVYYNRDPHSYINLNSNTVNKSEEMLKLKPTICGPQNKENQHTIKLLFFIFNELYLNFPDKFNDDVSYNNCYRTSVYQVLLLNQKILNYDFSNIFTNRTPLNDFLISRQTKIHECVKLNSKIADESKEIAQIVKNITHESMKLNKEFINNIACNVSYNNVTIKENYMDAIKSLINVSDSLEILIESLNVQNANKSKNLLQQVQEKYQNQKKILNQSIPCNGSNTYVNFRNEMLNILSVFENTIDDIAHTLSSNIINYKQEILLDLQTTVSNVKHCIEILIKLQYITNREKLLPTININKIESNKPSQETSTTDGSLWTMPTRHSTYDIDRRSTSQGEYPATVINIEKPATSKSGYDSTDINHAVSTPSSQETDKNQKLILDQTIILA